MTYINETQSPTRVHGVVHCDLMRSRCYFHVSRKLANAESAGVAVWLFSQVHQVHTLFELYRLYFLTAHAQPIVSHR